MTESIGTRPPRTPEIVERPEQHAAIVLIGGRTEELSHLFGEAFAETARVIEASGAAIAGPPFARYRLFGERIEAEAGFPFTGTLRPTDRVQEAILPGGRTVTTTHVGPYNEVARAWDRTQAWMREHDLKASGPAWECYLTGPDDPGPPVTEIFFPLD